MKSKAIRKENTLHKIMGNENLILLHFFLLPKGVEQQHFGIENIFISHSKVKQIGKDVLYA